MQLVDHQIASAQQNGLLGIEPFCPACVEPASYDVHLGPTVLVYHPAGRYAVVDLKASAENEMERITLPPEGWVLAANSFALASTLESVALAPNISSRIEGKSSLGRRGLSIHVTAGFIDPGFRGQITLELVNELPDRAIKIYPGMKIAQLSFVQHEVACVRPYDHHERHSKYQGQQGPVASAMHRNF